jgi:hypothetical protein
MNPGLPLPGTESDGDAEVRAKRQQVTCGGCGASWSALSAAHCGSCHRLFASVSLFDMHRSQDGDHGACIPPGEVQGRNGEQRLFFRDGMWRGPELSDEQRNRLRGLAS